MHNVPVSPSRTIAILAAVVALVACLSGVSRAQTYVFNEAISATGNNPQAVAEADFNGDGRPDFAVANYNDGTVSVFLGNTLGTYPTEVLYPTGPNPIAVLVADFNNDGKLDLGVVDNNCPTTPCPSAGSVSILLGNGDGTFQTALNTTVGNGPFGLATADFNKDGKADLAVSNRADNTVTVLLGAGNGTFTAGSLLTVGNNPAGVAAFDVNQDGNPDVVVANTGDSDVSLFVGHGNGKFGAQNTYATGAGPVGVAVGDFNSDKIPDLVTANSGATTVSVLISKGASGNGFITPRSDFTVVGFVTGVFVDDFNSDGDADIAAVSPGSNAFSILLGSGSVSFQTQMPFATGNAPSAIVAADFTGDNFQDVAVVNGTDNTLAVYPGWNTGAFQIRFNTVTGNQPGSIATADFNDDGIQDMAIVNRGDNDVEVYLGNGNGTFTPVEPPPLTGTNPSWVTAADFNNDGIMDLAVTNATSNTVSVFLGIGNGTFGAAITTNVGKNPVSVAAADFNNDKDQDLAVVNQNDSTVEVLLGNGTGNFTLQKAYTTGKGSTPGQVALMDLVGNGDIDMIVADGATNNISIYFGFQNGTFTSPTTYAVGTNPTGVAIADVNGDNIPDIVTANNGSNNVSVLPGTGKGKFGTATNYSTAPSPYLVAIQDFNSDMKPDLAVSTSSTSSNRISVLVGNGDGTFQLHVDHESLFTAKGLGEGLAVADFNGDGAPDMAESDQFSNNISVFLNSAVTAFSPGGTLNFGGVNVGTQSNPITELLTNSGSAPLNDLAITATPTPTFEEITTCASSLVVGADCTTSVTFTPPGVGTYTGSLAFADNASTSPQVLPMTGMGNGPVVMLSTSSLVFGVTLVGQTSPTQKVTLMNTGNQTLTITSIKSSTTNFKVSNTCNGSVVAGGSCTISVAFSPKTSGIITGTITIIDNASNSPQTISLSGTATAVKLTPLSLSFGTQKVGTTSAPQTVTLMNAGTSTIAFTSIIITGSNPNDFAIQSTGTTCPTTGGNLAGGASCTVAVVFAPTATGSRTATLSFNDNGGASPQTVALAGTGD